MKRNINKNISDEKAFSIIKKPLMTEKSTNLNQYNQYSFIVSKDSCTYEIKKAIERIFKVKVNLHSDVQAEINIKVITLENSQ